jgi:glutathione synthase/RimK-type ligase-like ATP-grasp enzyme
MHLPVKIAIITDYLGRFGSKQKSELYRQGMDLDKLKKYFSKLNYQLTLYDYSNCIELINTKEIHYVIYTSSEDPGELYKSYIEDHLRLLSLSHHYIIPNELFLRAHNNKVFMEMLRIKYNFHDIEIFNSRFVATKKELKKLDLSYPVIMKAAVGALSRTVKLINNYKEAQKNFDELCPKVLFSYRVHEIIRRFRHRNKYNPEEIIRGKVIIQNFIPNISFDWKVLIYFDKIFILKRNNRPNDFRASGSGLFSYDINVNKEILNLAWTTRLKLNVPHLSLDIAMNEKEVFIFEFQVIGFGTKTIENAPFYFEKKNSEWTLIESTVDLEEVYVTSLNDYINFTLIK